MLCSQAASAIKTTNGCIMHEANTSDSLTNCFMTSSISEISDIIGDMPLSDCKTISLKEKKIASKYVLFARNLQNDYGGLRLG